MEDKVTDVTLSASPLAEEGARADILGLTQQEVQERIQAGKVNGKMEIRTKSYAQIFRTNFCTLFNFLNLVLVILVITLGNSVKNSTFAIPALINLVIGIVQEIKAKRTIDKLSLISAPKVKVIRDGVETEIKVPDIVMDDVMVLRAGNQICSDCVIAEGVCEVDESLITGESDPVQKSVGDELLSGSYIVSGTVTARVIRVGMDNYAAKISSGAKYIKATNSDILLSLRAVIRAMSIVVIPLGAILFLKTYIASRDLAPSIVKMVSSMSSMIPQGLIALTSTVFAISVIRLSRHKTLAQDLYCIETLARVDVLCLDKTGTITEGDMQVNDIVCKSDTKQEDVDFALKTLVTLLADSNPTSNAIREKYKNEQAQEVEASVIVPFSSARKWSGVSLQNGTSYAMGAPEFVLKEKVEEYREEMDGYAQAGERVLVLVRANAPIVENVLPADLTVMAFILIGDKIRKEAPDTLRFFREQDVDIRIISGDNPITVSAIAKKAGLQKCEYVDMSTIQTDEDLLEAARRYKVFGRVTPDQKLKLVRALRAGGHTVAMTGDGVNDVLALKEADCSIAMAAGSDAARNAAQLVLLDNNFASMPKIVAEGRRSINNLQRSASLYLVKTMYSALLTMLFIFIPYHYPFDATNITLVGAATIGIPSFILALEPNKERVRGRFLPNALANSMPAAINIVVSIAFLQLVRMFLSTLLGFELTEEQITTVSVVLLAFGAFIELLIVCIPFNWKHSLLFVGMVIIFVLGWMLCSVELPFKAFNNIFSMTPISEITREMWITMGISLGSSIPFFLIINYVMKKYAAQSSERLIKTLKLNV